MSLRGSTLIITVEDWVNGTVTVTPPSGSPVTLRGGETATVAIANTVATAVTILANVIASVVTLRVQDWSDEAIILAGQQIRPAGAITVNITGGASIAPRQAAQADYALPIAA